VPLIIAYENSIIRKENNNTGHPYIG
jgi:hypothetical protein